MKTRRNRKKRPSRKTKQAKKLSDAEAEEQNAKAILKMLGLAERHGLIRWVLEGFGAAFRKLQAQREGHYGLLPKHLFARRAVVADYVYSLVCQLDALTLGDVVVRLLDELQIRGTKEGMKRANEFGISREPERFASRAIVGVMRHAPSAFCELVKEGNEDDAVDFVFCTEQLVETLDELARESPDTLQGIASQMIDWPIMATRHHPKRSDFAKLADRIGLATKSPVTPRERHKWKPHTPLNRYLVDLLVTECWGDGRLLRKESVAYYLDEILMPLFDKVATEVGGWDNCPEFSAIAQGAAKRGKAGVRRSEIRNRVKKALKALSA